MAKPSLRELVEATGTPIDSWFYDQSNPQYAANQQLLANATAALYGDVGANLDARDWAAIMASEDPLGSAKSGLATMYSDPAYRESNTQNLVAQGYDPAQAYYTYGQMNERVGANYTPTPTEVSAVENYFEQIGQPNYTWNVPQSSAPRAAATANTGAASVQQPTATGGLTPEIARNLMQRSMTTGVPTSEFDKYGGYDAVRSLYDSNKGTYSLDELDPAFLDQMDNIIANTGVGNLSVLKMTGQPLTEAGRQAMQNNGVSWTNDDLKAMGIPYEGFLQAPKAGSLTGSANNTTGQLNAGSSAMDTSGMSGLGGNWNARQAVGAADGSLMGAGNANYNSSLIKSLRQSSLTPYSTNTGVLMAPNQGASTSSLAPSMDQMGGAFNPQVLNPRAATDQEVADWNAYSTYRTNSLNNKTPILSMAEWLAGGKSDGKAPATQAPVDGFAGYFD